MAEVIMNFKVGDKVVVTSKEYSVTVEGSIGTITDIDYRAPVEHNIQFQMDDGSKWWISNRNIALIEEPKVESKKSYVEGGGWILHPEPVKSEVKNTNEWGL